MKIAIIGGGMAGLGAAYELTQENIHEVTIFERSKRLGGLASTVKVSGEQLEAFYHHLFPNCHDIIEVSDKLGISNDFFLKHAKSGIFYGEKIFPFDTAFDLLRFNPLNFWERLRTGLVLASLRLVRNWKRFERVSAHEWSRRKFGERAYSVIWEPLLESKFGSYSRDIGMSWFWGRIYERPSRFGYFRGSFATLIDRLGKYLESKGIKIVLGKEIKKIERGQDNTFILTMDDKIEVFDHVIIAAAPEPLSKIAASVLPGDFLNGLGRYKYLGVLCAIVVLKQHLTGYYWINMNEKDSPFLGIIEQTNFVPPETYGGFHPIYLPRYLDTGSDLYHLSDEEVWSRYLPALKKINGNFNEDWIVEKCIFRAPFAQPVITPDYRKILPSYKTPVPNLWWVSMSHVYPWDRGMEHSFHAGKELAQELLRSTI